LLIGVVYKQAVRQGFSLSSLLFNRIVQVTRHCRFSRLRKLACARVGFAESVLIESQSISAIRDASLRRNSREIHVNQSSKTLIKLRNWYELVLITYRSQKCLQLTVPGWLDGKFDHKLINQSRKTSYQSINQFRGRTELMSSIMRAFLTNKIIIPGTASKRCRTEA
jgi:hypothetical protein